jgi:PAS domain S-box-containing protein
MKNILIFQAADNFAPIISKFLSERKYEPHFINSISDAVEHISKHNPIAVLFDIDSSPENANALLGKMDRSVSPPVVLIGTHVSSEKLDVSTHNSVYAFLTKPVDLRGLSNILYDIESDFGNTYRDLIESQSMFGVCIVQDNYFKFVNKKFIAMTGYTYDELINNIEALDIITPVDHKYVQNNYERMVSEDSGPVNLCFSFINKQGQENDVEVSSGKITFNGKPAVQAIVSDISERKAYKLREKAFEFRMMNEQKLASIGQLATGIAHNLNTPISIILSNAELLALKHSDSPELDKIIRQADRMSEIINNLLTKSKQEQIQHPQDLNLNDLIENELEFMNSNLEFKHNVEKEYKFASHLPNIKAIYSDFSQSILNILQNAVDAMYQRDDKKLTLQTRVEDGFIYLSIADTGCGIDEGDLNKLFDPFFSTKPSPLERKGNEPTGTGLGLSTVYNLLTPYGVEIKINSKAGIGTEMVLKIPVNGPAK